MYKIVQTLFLIAILVSSLSCEEVIEINLNSSNPAIVAEGYAENNSLPWIKLSYTSDYFDNEESSKINNATVTLNYADGSIHPLNSVENGVYEGDNILKAGQNYTLNFEVNGEVYSASSYLHPPSEIYTITFEKSGITRPTEDETYTPTITFKDQQAIHNYYMFKFWVDGIEEDERYYLIDDENYNPGDTITYEPFMVRLEPDAKLDVVLYSIDEASFVYYTQLSDNLGEGMGGSSTPFNPESNFGSQIMGFFSARSSCKYSVQVSVP